MNIGLVGENPSDTSSIEVLLNRLYPDSGLNFIVLTPKITGSNLDHQKTKPILRKAYERNSIQLVIFIRDLDAQEDNNVAKEKRKSYFIEFNSIVDKKGILLLSIEEIEALLLSDISMLNNHFQVELEEIPDPMKIENTKEWIRQRIPRFSRLNNSVLFAQLDLGKVMNVRFFKEFIEKFEAQTGLQHKLV